MRKSLRVQRVQASKQNWLTSSPLGNRSSAGNRRSRASSMSINKPRVPINFELNVIYKFIYIKLLLIIK